MRADMASGFSASYSPFNIIKTIIDGHAIITNESEYYASKQIKALCGADVKTDYSVKGITPKRIKCIDCKAAYTIHEVHE